MVGAVLTVSNVVVVTTRHTIATAKNKTFVVCFHFVFLFFIIVLDSYLADSRLLNDGASSFALSLDHPAPFYSSSSMLLHSPMLLSLSIDLIKKAAASAAAAASARQARAEEMENSALKRGQDVDSESREVAIAAKKLQVRRKLFRSRSRGHEQDGHS
jgi:hypothetical protein